MTTLHERAADELRSIVEQYAAGEAEVVRAYFAQPHVMDDHVDVLLRQMAREIQTANWLNRAQHMLDELEVTVDRHDLADILEQIAEETAHYVLLADLAEWTAGRKLGRDDLRRYEVYARWDPMAPPDKLSNALLPEANRMLEVGRSMMDELGYALSNEIGRLSEGGGGGAFIECTRLAGDEFQRRIADAMTRIVKDEMHHGPERVDGFARSWIRSDDDLATATRWLRTFMAQHLRVRNEIWRFPLSPDRLAAIDRGEVTAAPTFAPASR
jgi:hypothetical protein